MSAIYPSLTVRKCLPANLPDVPGDGFVLGFGPRFVAIIKISFVPKCCDDPGGIERAFRIRELPLLQENLEYSETFFRPTRLPDSSSVARVCEGTGS